MPDEKTDQPEPANPPTDNIEDATEAGYLGQPPDPNPNEVYTVEGVTGGGASKSSSKSSGKSSGSGSSGSGTSSSKE